MPEPSPETRPTASSAGQALGAYWLSQLGLATAWVGLWHLGAVMDYAPHASLWFPPAALTYAAFRHQGLAATPGLLIGLVIINRQMDIAPADAGLVGIASSDLMIFLGHALPYYAAAQVMQRLAPDGRQRALPSTATGFLVVATLASLAAAVLGIQALLVGGLLTPGQAAASLTPWWVGDFAALLALGPAFIAALGPVLERLGLADRSLRPPQRYLKGQDEPLGRFWIKLVICLGMVLVAAGLAAWKPDHQPLAFLVFFVIIPQMWIVHSEGALRSLASIALLSTAIAVSVGAFGLSQHALTFQFALIIIAAAAYFGMAVPMLYADNTELRMMVMRDSLTGAATRHHFTEQAEQEIQRARRYRESVCLAAFDIDYFKQINDRFGHTAGDLTLARVTRLARDHLRASDLVGRIGGDEFAVLMPMSDLDTARGVCQRLCDAVTEMAIPRYPELSTTISLGLVQVDLDGESYAQAFDRADRALYEAKNAGRARMQAA